MATDLLPTTILKAHIFILSQDKHIESLVLNAVWLCFVLHGVPLKRSVFHYQWEHGQEKGKIILDIHNPTTILSGEYNSPPPE